MSSSQGLNDNIPDQPGGLASVLKIRHVVAIALGFTVADGILLVLSQLFEEVGPSIVLLMLVAGIAMSFVMFAGAELAGAMPSADFVGEWGKKTLNSFWGHLGALSYGAVAILVAGALWYPMGTYLHQFFPIPVPVIGTICFLIAAAVVYFGAEISGKAELYLNVALFAFILALAITALFRFDGAHFQPFFIGGSSAWANAFPFVIYVLFGPELMFAASEETVGGRQFWPKAMAVTMLVILASYTLLEVALIGLLPLTDYSLGEATAATAAKSIFGSAGQALFSVIAFMAVFHAVIGALYAGSRFIYKMAKRGYLPNRFAWINQRTHAPEMGLLFTVVVGGMIGSTYYILPNFYLQATALITTAGLFGWFVICLSHVRYRLSPSLRQAYPADWHVWPGEGAGGIWISILGLVVTLFVAGAFIVQDAFPWWFVPAWIALAVIWWLVTRKSVESKTAALDTRSQSVPDTLAQGELQ